MRDKLKRQAKITDFVTPQLNVAMPWEGDCRGNCCELRRAWHIPLGLPRHTTHYTAPLYLLLELASPHKTWYQPCVFKWKELHTKVLYRSPSLPPLHSTLLSPLHSTPDPNHPSTHHSVFLHRAIPYNNEVTMLRKKNIFLWSCRYNNVLDL